MNAYHELFYTKRIAAKKEEPPIGEFRKWPRLVDMNEKEIEETLAKLRFEHPTEEVIYDRYDKMFYFSPSVEEVMKDCNIVWAYVDCRTSHLMLPSGYSEDELCVFLESLLKVNYYAGFGGQELYGEIAYNDGTWMERGEYDGSEWWNHQKYPKEPDWEKMKQENREFEDDAEDYSE